MSQPNPGPSSRLFLLRGTLIGPVILLPAEKKKIQAEPFQDGCVRIQTWNLSDPAASQDLMQKATIKMKEPPQRVDKYWCPVTIPHSTIKKKSGRTN